MVVEDHHHPGVHQRLDPWPTKGALLEALFQVGELGGNQEVASLQKAHRLCLCGENWSPRIAAHDDWVSTFFTIGKRCTTKITLRLNASLNICIKLTVTQE